MMPQQPDSVQPQSGFRKAGNTPENEVSQEANGLSREANGRGAESQDSGGEPTTSPSATTPASFPSQHETTPSQHKTGPPQHKQGKVYLVGAGPGDPGLITVRGAQCLGVADVVLFDGLANAQLLDLAPQADCQSVGKHGRVPFWAQSEINDHLVTLAKQGKTVVRLKGGDPAVFARTAEELEVLTASGVAFEVVPGITAALAAASYVGIPITHRQHASAVAFITGQQQTAGPPQSIDWSALANFPGTLVFYMGVTTAEEWSGRLIAAGKDPSTPVAIVRRCTWGDQQILRSQLDEVADLLTPASKLRPPVIVIIGEVAKLGQDFDWFSRRLLHGCGVLITRPRSQSAELTKALEELGASVYQQPCIEITRPDNTTDLDAAIRRLASGGYDGVTFSSGNGVRGLLCRAQELGLDSRIFATTQIAAVGPSTAAALSPFGLKADSVPDSEVGFDAASLIAVLRPHVVDQRWLITKTHQSRDTLAKGLIEAGAHVDQVIAYESRTVEHLRPSVENALRSGSIHYCTATSDVIADAAHALLGEYRESVRPVSLSEKISAKLEDLSWPAVATAESNTMQALVEAICQLHSQPN